MDNFTITNAQYLLDYVTGNNLSIKATIDGQVMSVPLDPNNRHYVEILRQVEAGDLTIAAAD